MVESYFARHADAVDAMLLTARLSGVFAAYAWQYSTYVENQMPCLARKDRWMSPEQIVTSVPPDWGKIKVFGCDAYELIPNNKFAKYPGTARGRKLLFIGYLRGRVGAALFDPVSRQVITGATNVIYVENMNDRIDALRHFDARREALKKNSRSDSLPLQINDFDESQLQATSSSATRKLFTSPDEQELGPSQLLAEESEDPADSQAEQPQTQAVGGAGSTAKSPSALHPASLKADEVRKILIGEANMRPVRMVPVGTVSKVTLEERASFWPSRCRSSIP